MNINLTPKTILISMRSKWDLDSIHILNRIESNLDIDENEGYKLMYELQLLQNIVLKKIIEQKKWKVKHYNDK